MLKTAQPKLRKAIVSNCNKELEKSICECVLNMLNGNVKLSGCDTYKLRKHKAFLRKVDDKLFPLSSKKKLIVQRRGFLLPLLSAVLPRSLVSYSSRATTMLRRMYLVSADQFHKNRHYLTPPSPRPSTVHKPT